MFTSPLPFQIGMPKELNMKRVISIVFALVSVGCLFAASAETKLTHVGALLDTDLGIVKTGPDSIARGANITYTITVSNAGPDAAIDAAMNDVLPADLTFVSVSSPMGWSCTMPAVGANGTVNCTNPTFGVTGGEVFTLVAKVGAGTTPGTFISNRATIASSTPDTNEENDSSTSSALVMGPTADLGVTKAASADTLPADSDVTYTITVINGGPDTAANVALDDALPGLLAYVSLSSPAGWSCTTPSVGSSGAVSCTKPSLTVADGAQVFSLVGHIPLGTANGTVYSFAATVSTSSTDPTSENDSSTSGVVVGCLTNPVVTTNADSGPGSLRRAIQDACTGSTITFDMTQVTSPIALTSGQLVIDKDLTIQGPGANLLTVARSTAGGTPDFRILTVSAGSIDTTIKGLTISGGHNTSGAGLLSNSSGTVTITECIVSGNVAGNNAAGGVFNNSITGTINITNSSISGNSAALFAGGVLNSFGTINITGSTVNGNSGSLIGGGGGGITNDAGGQGGGTVNITNSTISGNSAGLGGGGISLGTSNTVTLTNVTVTNNRAGSGGGIAVSGGGTVTLKNTIIARNFRGTGVTADDIGGTVVAASFFNVIGTGGSGGLTNGVNNNQVGVADPKLGLLANNGGPTFTHALLAGSPALDAGSNAISNAAGLTTDQRGTGFPRIVVGAVDIGAYEVLDTTPPVIVCPGSITKFTDSGQFNAIVNPGVPVATDNFAVQSVTGVRSDGKPLNAPYPVGVTLITWTAMDTGGNKATCAQSIAVVIPSGPRRHP